MPIIEENAIMTFKQIVGAVLLAATLAAPATARAEGYFVDAHAYVVAVAPWDVLNMRRWPAWYSQKVGYIPHHGHGVYVERCIVRPHGASSDWCKVRYKSRWGWVNSRYLAWH